MKDFFRFGARRALAWACALAALAPACAERNVFVAPPSIPAAMVAKISSGGQAFVAEMDALALGPSAGLLTFVDKKHFLGADYVPAGLTPLRGGRNYVCGREGLSLIAEAEAALDRLAAAARAEGITLVASSSYRSYDYQKTVFERNVRQMGRQEAERESAPPGASQHQLGTAVDFGSITDEFAETKAGRWLSAHAGEYGWSLSFPKGGEPVTGYRWECWHYRYIGADAVATQNRWFEGSQQYLIEFVSAWRAWRLQK